MQMFLKTLFECSVVMSVISIAYIVAMPFLSKRYVSKWLYYSWLLIVIGWVFPFRPKLDMNFLPFQLPDVQIIQAKYIGLGEPLKTVTNTTNGSSYIPLLWLVASVWALGIIGFMTYYAWRHGRFLKMVNRWSEDITNEEVLDILSSLRAEMKIRKHVKLKACPLIASPMMIGFFRSTILMPCNKFDIDELKFILRHELIHLKRKDLWYKVLILLAVSVHWFNPVVYIMAKVIAVQCEISCDESLVKTTSLEQRKRYGEILIGIVRNGVKFQTALSTNFYKEGNFIKMRIFSIMDVKKKNTGITVLFVILIAMMGSRVTFASSVANKGSNSFIIQNDQKIYSLNNKKIINVDVETLESKKYVCFDGTYTFEEGDIIQYNANCEVNNKNYTLTFVRESAKTSDCKDPNQYITLGNPNQQLKVTQAQAGSYCLYICNGEGDKISNIKGTIQISKSTVKNSNG